MKKIVIALCIFIASANISDAQQSNTEAADFDGSGRVDFPDFLIFAGGFGKSTSDIGFDARLDFSGNGTVDFPDFLVFAQAFGTSPNDPQNVLLYIADVTGSRVEVLDIATNLLDPSRALIVDQPRGVALSTSQVYVAAIDTFYAFDKNSGAATFAIPLDPIISTSGGRESRGGFRVVLSKDQNTAFVTEEGIGWVEVFDLNAKTSTTHIPVSNSPSGITISPDGSRIYVAHGLGAQDISVIDTQNHTVLETIPVGAAVTRFAMSADGNKLYLNNTEGNVVQVLNTQNKTIENSLQVGQTGDLLTRVYDVALSPDGSRLFAAVWRFLTGFDTTGAPVNISWGGIVVIDTQTFTQVAEIQAGELVANMGVTPDGKTAYVAGVESLDDQATGNLQVFIIDLENNQSLGTIRGLSLPVAFAFNASKPAIPQLPQISFSF
jgi:YVTN family beta-propeller protein